MTNRVYIHMPYLQAVTPPIESGMFLVIANSWWAVKDESLLFYRSYAHPQCNLLKEITARFPACKFSGAKPIFIPVVYVPHYCEDYL